MSEGSSSAEVPVRTGEYEFFRSYGEREELVTILVRIVDYLHDNKIPNLVLVDRAARPAYGGIKYLWRKKYPQEYPRNIFFVNPSGFRNLDTPANFQYSMKKISSADEAEENVEGFVGPERSQEEIEKEFQREYRKLMGQREKPLLILDTCVHKGESLRPVKDSFRRLGFQDIKLGVVTNADNTSEMKFDFVALDGRPWGICGQIFGPERLVRKTLNSVSSVRRSDRPDLRDRSIRLRREVGRIVRESAHDWPK